ncbi:MAG: cobalamin biosynthesis protein [Microcoleus sp. PH2017_40_RAT_O_B]|uniref:cobalamin biosynthesis protein n=1 Tax=unclassified Microcoleus TaxID=2642155 RepID=UPI001DD37B66|nr:MULTISPECIES: cobalamin biosynthesis protein [unclassified Microcoleus]MCC3517728.1 cobalamin biosynthesis protein [Microcoleus sp. PH2017_18_LLB_O_A]MCC3571092.1 cobalamin biosynthesis protein [Microcoleus sp. PH2017_34_RAT_O_A]MCC3608655.1 cobalamin biosynthesis protein [Microcoleus sp. PH2017_40_RAT_O_B]
MSDEFRLDRLDIPRSWNRGTGDWTGVAAAMQRGETVEVIQEVGSTLWRNSLPEKHCLYWDGENISPIKGRIWISFTQRRFAPESVLPKVQWHPRVLWVGIGCKARTSRELIETAIQSVCRSYHLAESAIAGIATIDAKAGEIGLLELCRSRNWPLKTFAADVLSSVEVPNPSDVAAKEVGTPSVAEASALCAIEPTDYTIISNRQDACSTIISNRQDACSTKSEYSACGVGILPAHNRLLVPKKIFSTKNPPPLQGGVRGGSAVTVAVAVCPIDYPG